MYIRVYYSHKIKNIQRKFKKIIIAKIALLKNKKIASNYIVNFCL